MYGIDKVFHMKEAEAVSCNSNDDKRKVGAIILNSLGSYIGHGYNYIIHDLKTGKENQDKYEYIVHAEEGAIMNCKNNMHGGAIFVNWFPCKKCFKKIVNTGIKYVYYNRVKSDEISDMTDTMLIAGRLGIKVERVENE